MAAPMPFRKFKKLLKTYECTFKVGGNNHYSIYDKDGVFVSGFGIKHPGPKEVKPCYVDEFLDAINGERDD